MGNIAIMKKISLLTFLLGILYVHPNVFGVPSPSTDGELDRIYYATSEVLFIQHADECLARIEQAAERLSITGAAVVAYIPGEVSETWISKMKMVGRLTNGKSNYLSIAYSKASEMAITLQNSGDESRKEIHGEYGYQGGVIRQVSGGYLLTVFSGATGEQDLEVAQIGLDWLAQQF